MNENIFAALFLIAILAIILFFWFKHDERAESTRPVLADKHRSYNRFFPNMEEIARGPKDSCWSYFVDHTTGCIYIKYTTGWQCGLAIVLNPDGTPMTLEDLDNTR